jgi:wyosine [tRNA(Phe)-imidazoG37] synthetase (radical SAM superfamily)
VIAELDCYLSTNLEIDYVTFSGSGEPTLHTGIGTVIEHLKKHYPQLKIAVLTNGTLLGDPFVQAQLAHADLVVPSLDGATETSFQEICRPTAGLTAEAVIDGLASFRRRFSGLFLLEIFLVPGKNDRFEELAALKQAATFIGPDAIQLNYLDRPAPHPGVTPPSANELQRVRALFQPLRVQTVLQRKDGESLPWDNPAVFHEVLALLGKGASSLSRLSLATGIREGDRAKILAQMSHQALVQCDVGKVWSCR